MYYIITLVIMIAIFFVWQIPANKQGDLIIKQLDIVKNTEINKNNSPLTNSQQSVTISKTAEPKKEIKKEVVIEESIDNEVPFTSQAPFGGWDDERQQDGCEEASALMAVYWGRGERLNKLTAWNKITDISDFEQKNYGEYRDIALKDIVDRIFIGYFNYSKVSIKNNIVIKDIIVELKNGNLVLAPMDGQKLGNPYFTALGPERHMLVIRGYDPIKKEFITNDPGTKRGEGYRYKEDVLFNAIRPYRTGYHEPIDKIEKNIIVVTK